MRRKRTPSVTAILSRYSTRKRRDTVFEPSPAKPPIPDPLQKGSVSVKEEEENLIFTGAVAPLITKATRLHKGYHLTSGQDHSVDIGVTGQSLKIEAFVGAGKTSTLSAISSAKPTQKGLYLALTEICSRVVDDSGAVLG